MSDTDMTSPTDPLADLPLHQLLFLKIRDGGGPQVASGVADLHGLTVDEVKAHCQQAGDEILTKRPLQVYEQSVYDWAKS